MNKSIKFNSEERRARRDTLVAELLGEKEAGEVFNERKERHKIGRNYAYQHDSAPRPATGARNCGSREMRGGIRWNNLA